MNLFIIGNGFDLAHNLPTQYINFREYLDEQDWAFLMMLEETYGFCSDSNIEFLKEYLWQNFESNLSYINETEILELGAHIDLGLEGGDYGVEETLDYYWEEQYGYIKKLNDEGTTIVLITHDMSIAEEAKRIVRIQDGKIISDQPAGRVSA